MESPTRWEKVPDLWSGSNNNQFMKHIKLIGLNGEVHMLTISWEDPEQELPSIAYVGGRGFYNVGTLNHGMLNVYEECKTYVDTRPL